VRPALLVLALATSLATSSRAAIPHGPWERLIQAPASRDVRPVSILRGGRWSPIGPGDQSFRLQGKDQPVTFDFGLEVGGTVSLLTQSIDGTPGYVSLASTESPLFIGPDSDNSAGGHGGHDGALALPLHPGRRSVVPEGSMRGGFRYLTIRLPSNAGARLTLPVVHLTFSPGTDLRDYAGYFFSSDPLLNRIWYAGAYTVQTNIIPTGAGRAWPFVRRGWSEAAQLADPAPRGVLVDGAKRDRPVWPGDMGVAVPTAFVSTGNLQPVRTALQVLFDNQDEANGALPECGPPLLKRGSDTYHLWTLIGASRYVLYSGDLPWIGALWPRYLKAIDYAIRRIKPTGLLEVEGVRDWGRLGQGGQNLEANTLLVEALRSGADLADRLGDTADGARFRRISDEVTKAINDTLWDARRGAYRDNPTSDLLPQDGNALAVLFGISRDQNRTAAILRMLKQRWNRFGAVSAELPHTISPFIGSLEVAARFAAGDDQEALDLIRTEWGFMLRDPDGTRSTLLEGYLDDGSLGYRGDQGYEHDPSYVSHAHGWSSGPTSSLTFAVLGLTTTDIAGRAWSFAPHPGGLAFAQGGFTTSLGVLQASWQADAQGNVLAATLDAPAGSTGEIRLRLPAGGVIRLDGKRLDRITMRDGRAVLHVDGGHHTVTISR